MKLESYLYLQTIDARWKEHLQAMDHLREGIHMRSYGQRDPKQEYKREGYNYFQGLMTGVRDEVLEKVFKAEVQSEQQASAKVSALKTDRKQQAKASKKNTRARHERVVSSGGGARPSTSTGRPAVGSSTSTSGVGSVAPGGLGLPSGRDDDGTAGMNRAQRRREKAKSKKGRGKSAGA